MAQYLNMNSLTIEVQYTTFLVQHQFREYWNLNFLMILLAHMVSKEGNWPDCHDLKNQNLYANIHLSISI